MNDLSETRLPSSSVGDYLKAVAGQRVRISKVRDEDAAMLDYFGDRNLVPGRRLRVGEVRALDGVVTVEDEDAEV